MILGWFLPVGVLIGVAGTRTALRLRGHLKAQKEERA